MIPKAFVHQLFPRGTGRGRATAGAAAMQWDTLQGLARPWPPGASPMTLHIRALDWSATPLGPTDKWPGWLRTAVTAMLDSPLPTVLVVGAQRVQIYNDAYEPLLGERHPAGLGQHARECWPEAWDFNEVLFQQVLASGDSRLFRDQPFELLTAGRMALHNFDISYIPVRDADANVRAVSIVSVETTERVALERNSAMGLLDARLDVLQLRQLFEQAPGFVALLRGPRHRFEMANPAYMNLVDRKDLIGLSVRDVFPEAVAAEMCGILDEVRYSGRAFVAEDMQLALRDGDGRAVERHVDFVYQPIVESDGTVSEIFVQGNDVTRQVLAGRALARVARQKDEFLAILAHELRNPLAPIATVAAVLEKRGGADGMLLRLSAVLKRQAAHMTGLIDDLLDTSRIGHGLLRLDLAPLDLRDAMTAAAEQVAGPMALRGHVFDVRMGEQPMRVNADSGRLVQVLANVLNNAAKYTPPGGKVVASAAREGDWFAIEVRDNGSGISPELLPLVFESFSQGERGVGRSGNGLGLGLALVRSLVELHGGTVTASSPGIGLGSAFTVRLPAMHDLQAVPAGQGAGGAGLSPARAPG